MKIIITGATGTAGAEAVRQALASPAIEQVTVLARRPLPAHIVSSPPPPKLHFIQHSDFSSYPSSLLAQLRDHDAVLWALGVSAVGIAEPQYEVITKDYPLAAARAFAGLERAGAGERGRFVFCYCSGQGVSQEVAGAGRLPMFGRVKGRAEAALAGVADERMATYSFRPGGIVPVHPVPEAGRLQRWVGPVLFPIMRLVSSSTVIGADELAKGMLRVALAGGGTGGVPGWPGKGAAGDAGAFSNDECKTLASELDRA